VLLDKAGTARVVWEERADQTGRGKGAKEGGEGGSGQLRPRSSSITRPTMRRRTEQRI